MVWLNDYNLLEVLNEGFAINVYRGERLTDHLKVILKAGRSEISNTQINARIRHEYEITKELNLEGILKLVALEENNNNLILIYEDNGGVALHEIQKEVKKFEIIPFLNIAVKLSQILGELHAENIVHKDIKPQNIIINQSTEDIKIIDFGISSKISLKIEHLGNPEVLEGTLAYISPEQTGRMNRQVDYRSDLYSLGVTFYEMLSGIPPFENKDSMELVHAHLALLPKPLSEVETTIPKTLSNIIMKLLSKNAEDRYQNAFGLKSDLEICLKQFIESGVIQDFPLGQNDFSGKFQIHQKLYGREEQIKILLDTFENVTRGEREFVLVSGFSGVGKSVLVNEVHKPITEKRGNFISGKYDQFQRNVPYYAFRQVFEEFVQILLTENAKSLENWKNKILNALGSVGQVLLDVMPSLELIIGKQPSVPELGSVESQIRFNIVFRNFIKAISGKEHPLVVFIDDLQWADSASLNLLKTILSDNEIDNFFLIGAYRDNEVDSSHPFILTLDEIKKSGTLINNINLPNLSKKDVNDLISDSLNSHPNETLDLTEIVYQKTEGNAFFTNEFLRSLYEEELLKYNHSKNGWVWDAKQISSLNMTDNVVTLMIRKLEKFPLETKEVLKLASCIGNKFPLKTVSIIYEKNLSETLRSIWTALEDGLILPTDENYKLISFAESEINSKGTFSEAEKSEFKFSHDRVQQASYALISEANKKEIHLKIGRLLLSHSNEKEVKENIFGIVNQFNNSLELVIDQVEKVTLAKLNLSAGLKAKSSTAYHDAKSFFEKTLLLLPDDSWKSDNYNITLQTHLELINVEYLQNNPNRAEELSEIVIANAKSNIDSLKVYEQKTYYLNKMGEYAKALDIVILGLSKINYKLKRKPGQVDVLLKLLSVKFTLRNFSFEKILNLPFMNDNVKLEGTKFYMLGASPAYFCEPNALPIVTFEACILSIKNGISPITSYAFAAYALILCGALGDIDNGYKYGEVSLLLWDKVKNKDVEPRVIHLFFGTIKHWKEDIRSCTKPLLENTKKCLSVGDLEFYAYSLADYFHYSIYASESLEIIIEEYSKYTNLYIENMEAAIQFIAPSIEFCILLSKYEIPISSEFSGKYFEPTRQLPLMRESNLTALGMYHMSKLYYTILFKEFENGISWAIESKKYIDENNIGHYDQSRYYFFRGIICAALIKSKGKDRKKYYKDLKHSIDKFKKWSGFCPVNHLHSYLFLKALKAEIDGKTEEASTLYDEAIDVAVENKFINDAAMICEFTFESYQSLGKQRIAELYLLDAYKYYSNWGAKAKLKWLEEKYGKSLFSSSLFGKKEESSLNQTISISNTRTQETISPRTATTFDSVNSNTSSFNLDLLTVMKSSQAISGEIRLNRLLSNLMKILVENAGAQKGIFILNTDKGLFIEASLELDSNKEQVMQHIQLEDYPYLPHSVINYVLRSKDNVVLDDAANKGNYISDPNIKSGQTKSILCTAIMNQGRLQGVAYFENNLTTNAFTKSRIQTINMLSSQAAISLENATLYSNLEEKTKQVELISKVKDEFLANLSHELNTPLTIVYGYSEMLKAGNDYPEEVRNYSKEIHDSAGKLNDYVHDLMLVTDIESNLKIQTSQINIKELISNAVEQNKSLLDEKQIQLETGIAEEMQVNGDSTLLEKAISAIIKNAVVYNKQGGLVKVTARKRDLKTPGHTYHGVEIKISDTGIGIAKEFYQKIFDKFFRIDSSLTYEVSGVGVGLFIAKKIVELHGGSIEVKSELASGSEFTLSLPLRN